MRGGQSSVKLLSRLPVVKDFPGVYTTPQAGRNSTCHNPLRVDACLVFEFLLSPSYTLYYAADWCRDELPGTYTGEVGIQFFELAAELWIWVLAGAACSALASHLLPRARLDILLSKHRTGSVIGATLLGLVSPLCTFAAIPVAARVLQSGVIAPPVMAFLFASPLMNPALFTYTYGALGSELATARTLTALSIGLVAGFGTQLLQKHGHLAARILPQPAAYPAVSGGSGVAAPMPGLGDLVHRFFKDLAFIAKWFTIGILIASLSAALLSPEFVRAVLGAGSRWSVPAAVVLGVPLYACGGGTIPIVEIMIQMGMTPGAALAFFIAGPATKFHTLGTLGAVFGRRVLLWYLLVMITGALLWGTFYPFPENLALRRTSFF